MNKIFRFVGIGTVLAATFALGAAAAFGQDACTDVDAQNAKYQEVLANYKSQDPAVLQKAVVSAKEFLEKYGACETAKTQVDWMKPKVQSGKAMSRFLLTIGIKRVATPNLTQVSRRRIGTRFLLAVKKFWRRNRTSLT